MRQRALPLLVLLLLSSGCSGLEDSLRDMNRSLYRGWAGDETRAPRPGTATASAGYTPCFNAESGLLYLSQTGRCAPGYTAIAIDRAEEEFRASGSRRQTTGAASPEITPLPGRTYAPARQGDGAGQTATASARDHGSHMALCYSDSSAEIFEAESCPPGSRWINSEEAAALQRSQLGSASWCYFASRRLLYRSRACRPGDQALSVAQADALWERLPPDRRPRNRPVETRGGDTPVPPVDASPRGGVSSTPLPAPR